MRTPPLRCGDNMHLSRVILSQMPRPDAFLKTRRSDADLLASAIVSHCPACSKPTIQNGRITFHPIADSAQVDRRRAELSMPPLSEYIEQMKAAYMQQQGDDN